MELLGIRIRYRVIWLRGRSGVMEAVAGGGFGRGLAQQHTVPSRTIVTTQIPNGAFAIAIAPFRGLVILRWDVGIPRYNMGWDGRGRTS